MYNIAPVTKQNKSYRSAPKFLNTHSKIDNKFCLLIYLHGTSDQCGSKDSHFLVS